MFNDRCTGIVTSPKSAIEDLCECYLQALGILSAILATLNGLQSQIVTLNNALNILCATRTTLNFENAHTGSDKLIEEIDRTQILWREDIATINIEHLTGIFIGNGIFAAAYLTASTTICRASGLVLREVALTRD